MSLQLIEVGSGTSGKSIKHSFAAITYRQDLDIGVTTRKGYSFSHSATSLNRREATFKRIRSNDDIHDLMGLSRKNKHFNVYRRKKIHPSLRFDKNA